MDSTVAAAQTPRAALAALALQTMRHFIYISSADHAVIIAMPRRSAFRRHMSRWMSGLDMELTDLRRTFLQRYEALLALREVSLDNLGPRQAAMEVLLNLWRHPERQDCYLRAIVSKIRVLINEHLSGMGVFGAVQQLRLSELQTWDGRLSVNF